ncbi:lytic transglycosylase domain-containing protein [Pseudoflavonifractor sp. 524-17]|uniref:lytic transglycosylase domain-containing protein n=1 Tax=Pseudoflavonifractor sp. 524-17 TaxID=2304577 RepID=UPI001379F8CE|nr:lytic transglycosylase domain-containing protein [Pseudoflavonifractor sp. 524-17]NCE63690.1 lytic transglycosylase domain-containing protein [Pseudoflavonifractor sp. 524-17]
MQRSKYQGRVTAITGALLAGLCLLPAPGGRAQAPGAQALTAAGLQAAAPELELVRHRYLSANHVAPMAAAPGESAYRPDVPLSPELQGALYDACDTYGIPYAVALGLIEVESNFDPMAVNSTSGCYGLTQISPVYFPSGLSPAENIRAGMAYLGEQLERYGGDLPAALQSYHDGHDTGKRWYANAVLEAARKYGK